MPSYAFRMPRLFVNAPLAAGGEVMLEREHAHRLVNVLRLEPGAAVLAFNGRDGEWRTELAAAGRRQAVLRVAAQTRPQPAAGDLLYLFAPLKHARLDYLVQKATEMGAARLRPVITAHTQVARVNLDRMRANVVEAAEQCGILAPPVVEAETDLARLLASWPGAEPGRRLIHCDEAAGDASPVAVLSALSEGPLAVLIGPEGGFSEAERTLLAGLDFVTVLPLGPRILRADTAGVAALALVQAVRGDWRGGRSGAPPADHNPGI